MQPGVYADLTNSAYHSGPGISKSGLDLIARSPLHYRAALDAANDSGPTLAQLIGSAFHSLVLEPHLFVREYTMGLRQQDVPGAITDRDQLVALVEKVNAGRLAKLPTGGTKAELVARIVDELHGGDGEAANDIQHLGAAELKAVLTKANEQRPGKLSTSGTIAELARTLRDLGHPLTLWAEAKEEWMANNGHRQVLNSEQWAQVHAMRDALMAHPMARALIEAPGRSEHSVYWEDPESGELCRCRPDRWRNDNILIDLKSTDDASPEGFARSIADWRYHVQDPFYCDGVEAATGKRPKAFVFVVVEKQAPHAVGVYTLSEESVALGRAQYKAELARYAECRKSGQWPGYSDRVQSINLPAYYFSRHAEKLGATA